MLHLNLYNASTMTKKYKTIDTTEYTTNITGLSQEGRGIAHVDNKITFIFNALPHETVQFQYTKKRSQITEGTATAITSASPQRTSPQCPHFTICGGCSLQHMSPTYQQEFKLNTVLSSLAHHHLTPHEILPTLTGPTSGYRRKARMGVKFIYKKNKIMVGFRERNSGLIADINSCHVLDERIGLRITALKAFIHTLESRDQIPQIEIAATDDVIALVIRHMIPLSDSDLEAIKNFAKHESFQIYLQPNGLDSISLLVGDSEELHYQLPQFNLTFSFHPAQFTQINHTINQQMVSQAIALLNLQPTDQVLDLFCGIGNFTLAASRQAQKVTGVEGDASAILQAQKNAVQNNIHNTEFHVANLFEACHELAWARAHYDKIILDPPRSGAEEIIKLMHFWNPKAILYVSCNPATFVRDAALLKEKNYHLNKFSMMDMFPHTQHAEVMGLFIRHPY